MNLWVLLVVGAAVLIGFGDAMDYGQYGVAAMAFVALGCALVWFGLAPRVARVTTGRESVRNVTVVGLGACLVATLRFSGGLYASGGFLSVSVVLMLMAAGGATVLVLAERHGQALGFAMVLVAGAGAAMIISSPTPRIDVWQMYQAASRGLLHLQNIYTVRFGPHLPGQATHFAYFPGSAIILAPFYAIFGDVRYGILAAQLCSAALVAKIWPHRYASALALFILLYPRFTYSVEQSWSEPLALCGLLLFVYLVRRGRAGWGLVAFVVMLTLQQYDLLFIPLAAAWPEFGWKRTLTGVGLACALVLPWFVANPGVFVGSTVTYDLHYAFAAQSLSLFHGLAVVTPLLAYATLGLAAIGSVLAAVVAARRHSRFVLACAISFMSVCLFDKIARFNEWQFAVGLLLAAAAEGLNVRCSAGHVDALDKSSSKVHGVVRAAGTEGEAGAGADAGRPGKCRAVAALPAVHRPQLSRVPWAVQRRART